MKGEKIRLGLILSTTAPIAVSQIAERIGVDITFSSEGMDRAIPVARDMEQRGIEVIVSRRGTARMLRRVVDIPVVSVPTGISEIFKSLHQASALGGPILLTTFGELYVEEGLFERLINMPVKQAVYHDIASLEQVIVLGKSQGYEVVVGGRTGIALAEKYGLRGVEKITDNESLILTIEDAIRIAEGRRKEQENTERYRSIINSSSEGIIAVDREGRVFSVNQSATDMLALDRQEVGQKHVGNYLAEDEVFQVLHTGKSVTDSIKQINDMVYVFNHQPITMNDTIIGCVSTFKKVPDVIKTGDQVRRSLSAGLVPKYSFGDLVHQSPLMKDVIRKAQRFAATDSTILITGETGTGKEIVAHSIHTVSWRKGGPFVSINCAALPNELLESELFGYEEGAFTGARKGGKLGLFELAHRGTILLDEVGATTAGVQGRLLRVLQEREIMRVGGDRVISVDVRVIAASNKDLIEEVETGRFREDLYFRLAVLILDLPPLRERREEIPLLAQEIIAAVCKKNRLAPVTIPAVFMAKLVDYEWPGNVRQLRNFLERLCLLTDGDFSPDAFMELFESLLAYRSRDTKILSRRVFSLKEATQNRQQEVETSMILEALKQTNYNRGRAAAKLGISRSTLWRKLRDADIHV